VGRVGAGKGSEILLYMAEVTEAETGLAVLSRERAGASLAWLPRGRVARKGFRVILARAV
jgi:hypothetical protein